jgi:hypothetical protein
MDTQQLKELAGRIRAWLASSSINIKYNQSLDYSAALVGLRNWPEVQAFPAKVSAAQLDLPAAVRLAKRLKDKHDHTATPATLLSFLQAYDALPLLDGSVARLSLRKLALSWQAAASKAGETYRLEHVLELLSVALGYSNHSDYNSEVVGADDLSQSSYWFLELEPVEAIASSLGVALDREVFVTSLSQALEKTRLTVCYLPADFGDVLQSELDRVFTEDDGVVTEMAMTNSAGPFYSELELDPVDGPFPLPGEDLSVNVDGRVYALDQLDAPFSGDSVDVHGQVILTMLGRRVCGPANIVVDSASLDWSWAIDEDDGMNSGDVPDDAEDHEDNGPWLTKEEALAITLDLRLEDAEQIADAEINPTETMAGVHNGYLVDLSTCPPSDVVNQLVERYGATQIRIFGTAFDRISPFDSL